MLLTSLSIKNYQSLEDVTLDGLSQFNVLIGRNNAGKSSVFAALGFLNNVTKNSGNPDPPRTLFNRDPSRRLQVELIFQLSEADRREFLGLILRNQSFGPLDTLLATPFARQLTFM